MIFSDLVSVGPVVTGCHTTSHIILVKPNPPTVVQTSDVSAGEQAVVRCTTTGSRPAANISWSFRNKNISGEQTVTLDDVTKTYTVVSLLKLKVTAEDNGQIVLCKVTHYLFTSQPSASVNLNVQCKLTAYFI